MRRWLSMYRQENSRNRPSKALTDSERIIRDMLSLVEANSRQSVSILLDTANQLQVLEQLLLGQDSVD